MLKIKTVKWCVTGLFLLGALAILPMFRPAELAATFRISIHASKRVIDIISAAGSVYAIIGIVAAVVGGGGIGVALLASAKYLAKKYGKVYAAAW